MALSPLFGALRLKRNGLSAACGTKLGRRRFSCQSKTLTSKSRPLGEVGSQKSSTGASSGRSLAFGEWGASKTYKGSQGSKSLSFCGLSWKSSRTHCDAVSGNGAEASGADNVAFSAGVPPARIVLHPPSTKNQLPVEPLILVCLDS